MTAQPTVAVIGYASVDEKFTTAAFQGAGRTTLIRSVLGGGVPQPGAVAYFAAPLPRHGLDVAVVSWVGQDSKGDIFRDALRDRGVDVTGLVQAGSRSPSTYMFYDEVGESVVWFDAGDVDQHLTPAQTELVSRADAVLVGIGPPEATAAALSAIHEDALVLWAIKSDPGSLPPDLATALARRAQIVCLSHGELDFFTEVTGIDSLGAEGQGATVVTHGSSAVKVHFEGRVREVPVTAAAVTDDATGAGDTFAAGILARVVTRQQITHSALLESVAAACGDARNLLIDRATRG